MAHDMPEQCEDPFLDSCQKIFLWTQKKVGLASHLVIDWSLASSGRCREVSSSNFRKVGLEGEVDFHPGFHCSGGVLVISSHLSLNHEGRWGTTDDFATSFLHFFLFSTALWDLANSRPFHFLMLSSHLFLCLPCLLLPCGVQDTAKQ